MATSVEHKAACRVRRRTKCIILLGGTCSCGSDEDLQFDHVDPGTKVFNISEAIRDGMSWVKMEPEVMKCQLLCGPCHRAKTSEEQLVPHGGGKAGRMYGTGRNRKRCKCDPCRLKYNEYMRTLKRARRNALAV